MRQGNQLYLCTMCNETTPLVVKKKRLVGGVQHNYAECKSCGGKVTHSYTDKHVRSMLTKQRKTPPGPKKDLLGQKIMEEMTQLKARFDSRYGGK